MNIDSRRLSPDEVINTEVCIVGAGPAGITLARELAGQHFRVCLFESGDLKSNEDTALLADGENVGDPFPNLRDMRHRQYGGMSSLWYIKIRKNQLGLRHATLDPIDFEKRDWVPDSGWPFGKDHLNPFYERAQTVCKLGPFRYDTEAWENGQSKKIDFNSDQITTSMFQFGPRDIFLDEYRAELNKSSNVKTFCNANLVDLEVNENGQTLQRANFACLSGNRFSVVARIFILATGGIENARLLLQSRRQQKNGLANQYDVVGRYFMDHPLVNTGMLYPKDSSVFRRMTFYDLREVNNTPVMGKFNLTDAAMRREKLLNMSALVLPKDDVVRDGGMRSEATKAVKALFASARRRKLPKESLKLIGTAVTGIGDIFGDLYKHKIAKQDLVPGLDQGGWSLLDRFEERFTKFEVISQTEQSPHPDNRVTLSEKLDQLGNPIPKLSNRWSEFDRASVQRSQQLFSEEFGRAGLGKLELASDGERPAVFSLSTHHSMGTTRMNTDPRKGVVDGNCKVHGISNLFMAGSSVFPTGGFANPTLTIVALSIRLADHIKREITG